MKSKLFIIPILAIFMIGMAFAADNVTYSQVTLSDSTPDSGTTVTWSVNWSDTGAYTLANWTFSTDNTGAWVNTTANATFVNIAGGNQTTGTFVVNNTAAAEGTNNYSWIVYAQNTGQEWNNTGIQQFNITDITPTVTIRSPVAGDSFASTTIGFYVTASDNVDTSMSCYYNVDGSVTNTSFTPTNATEYGADVDGGTKGDSHTLYVYCNDHANAVVNSGSDSVAFTISNNDGGSSSSVESSATTGTTTTSTQPMSISGADFGAELRLAISNFWNWLTNLF